MRVLLRLFLCFIFLIPVALLAAVWSAVENTALVGTEVRLTPAEVGRAKAIIDRHDPRDLRDGEVRTITVRQRDLDLAANYLVYLIGKGGAAVELHDGSVKFQATARLPENPVGRYLNIDLGWSESADLPRIAHLRIGNLSVPPWLAEQLLARAVRALHERTEHKLGSDLLRQVAIKRTGLSVTYEWDSQITEAVRTSLVSVQDQGRLEIYHQHLVGVLSGGRGPIQMIDVLQSVFRLAQEQSKYSDAATENKAAIIAFAAYMGGGDLKHLAPQADTWPKATRRDVTLRGREDFARRFMISASLSIMGGNVFSDAIGLLKEVEDSLGGSGFSFNDLCADKAGARFGQRATSYSRSGEVLSRVVRSVTESDLMPKVSDLPQHMSAAEFEQRFGGIGSPRYNEMVAEIDRRVDRLPLYQ